MDKDQNNERWIWVIIHDSEGNEEILGQHDTENNLWFIPAFLDKEDARVGLSYLTKDPSLKFEVQAIEIRNVIRQAAGKGYQLFIMDRSGKVLEKYDRPLD